MPVLNQPGAPDRRGKLTSSRPATPERKAWWGLAVILVGPFLGTVDFFIANLGVPTIRRELGATFSEAELVVAGYGLSYAVCLITGGRLGDIFGRRRTFCLGMACFTVASALCGAAPNANALVGWRVVQGCAAALMFPQALSYIHVTFAGAQKRLAFSLYGAMIGGGSITGQILGGTLIRADLWGLSWRPIFLINLPLGVATILAAQVLLRETRAKEAPHLDLVGTAVVSLGLVLFSVPFLEGREAGWPPWAWACLVSSAPVLWAFYRWEQREANRGRTPLLQPRLFADRGFVTGMAVTCIYFAGHTSMLFALSLYLQLALGLDPMAAGLALVPFSFGFLVGSAASGKLNGWLGRNSLHLGTAVLAAALVALLVEVRSVPTQETTLFAATCLVYGVGRGFVTAPLYNTVLSGVPAADAGAAAGLASTMQQVANSVGIALLGAIAFSVLPPRPGPADYAHGFARSTVVNLGMLAVASLLICLIPKARGQGVSAAARPVEA